MSVQCCERGFQFTCTGVRGLGGLSLCGAEGSRRVTKYPLWRPFTSEPQHTREGGAKTGMCSYAPVVIKGLTGVRLCGHSQTTSAV